MRTWAYIDGFNLYNGAVAGTPYKWLNLLELCRRLLPGDEVLRVKYFTALVDSRINDPGQPYRQMRFWRALQTVKEIEIIRGHFLTAAKRMPTLESIAELRRLRDSGVDISEKKPTLVEVLRSEEKGTDVNLASHLVNDAHRGSFEAALVISNDSDLVEAVRIVRNEVGKVVGVFTPHRKVHSVQLKKAASFFREIPAKALSESLFPDELSDAKGAFRKPDGW